MPIKVGYDEVRDTYLVRLLKDRSKCRHAFLIWLSDRFPREVRGIHGHAIILCCGDHLLRVRKPIAFYLAVARFGHRCHGARDILFNLVAQRVELYSDILAVGVASLKSESGHGNSGGKRALKKVTSFHGE